MTRVVVLLAPLLTRLRVIRATLARLLCQNEGWTPLRRTRVVLSYARDHMPDEQLLKAFGQRIRHLRTAKGISQEQLAEQTGFHRTYIGMVERSERNLSLSNIGVFAKFFEMSVSELLDFETNKDYQTRNEA